MGAGLRRQGEPMRSVASPPLSSAERAALHAAERRDATISDDVRATHGVVHTPPQIARFAVSCAREAVGSAKSVVLDPACGPGIFLAAAFRSFGEQAEFVGIDRDPDALLAAETALRRPAQMAGLNLRLLEADALESLELARFAVPVAIVGNPPWAAKCAVRPPLSEELLEDFRRDETGARLQERKLGVLSDAYVRFWRWAAEAIRIAPKGGVVAFVTNASFLDGVVHRGMRGYLRRVFESIDVYDLGGSSLVARQERDANLFGVRPGAALVVAYSSGQSSSVSARIRHCALRGSSEHKLQALQREPVPQPLISPGPLHLFVPAPEQFPSTWNALSELFPFHREGIQTNRDAVAVGSREALIDRAQRFSAGERSSDLNPAYIERPHYDPKRARSRLMAAMNRGCDAWLSPIAYRPFDDRHVLTVPPLCHRPRAKLLAACQASGFSLLSVRKDRGDTPWAHFAVTNFPVDNCYFSSRSSCRTRAFPTHRPDGRLNLSDEAREWAGQLGGGEAVFDYVLAVLASESYRASFDSILHLDYPRVPSPRVLRASAASLVAAGRGLRMWFLQRRAKGGNVEPARIGHRKLDVPTGYRAALQVCEKAWIRSGVN